MMTKRSRLLPLMTTFDFSDTTLPCGQRDVTVVAPQALALMNNRFVHQCSEALARRVEREAGEGVGERVDLAWKIALQRAPRAEELEIALEYLVAQENHFKQQPGGRETSPLGEGLALWLRADQGVEMDEDGRVRFWQDSGLHDKLHPHDASQADPAHRPLWIGEGANGRPAIRFDGKQSFLHVAGQVVWSQQFSVFAVVTHRGKGSGPREIISNWHNRQRSTTSMFLGSRGPAGVRFTDAMSSAGTLLNPARPFILTGISKKDSALTFQNRRRLAESKALAERDLKAPYVIGTQGNYGTEWWDGEVAEILTYDRALDDGQRQQVWSYLEGRYQLESVDASHLALASLCHALFNTNEFIYVD